MHKLNSAKHDRASHIAAIADRVYAASESMFNPSWIKFSDRWPPFTFKDITVRSPTIGQRTVKFQAALFPHLPRPEDFAYHGFLFSDCVHPMENAVVPMEELEWLRDLSAEMNASSNYRPDRLSPEPVHSQRSDFESASTVPEVEFLPVGTSQSSSGKARASSPETNPRIGANAHSDKRSCSKHELTHLSPQAIIAINTVRIFSGWLSNWRHRPTQEPSQVYAAWEGCKRQARREASRPDRAADSVGQPLSPDHASSNPKTG